MARDIHVQVIKHSDALKEVSAVRSHLGV